MTLTGLSVRRPVLALVASLLIVVAGLLAFRALPLRELPDIDQPIVSVETRYPGANAEVVENRITQLIEDQLSGIEGVDFITSQSRDGRSDIRITFKLSRDLEAAANDVRGAVSRVADRLPLEAEEPEIAKQDADAQPIMWLSLTSKTRDVAELSDYARRYVTDRLAVIDGVSFVRVGGGQDYAMRIWLDCRALAARGLTGDDVEQALRRYNVELPAGEIEAASADLGVLVPRQLVAPEDFAALPVGRSIDGHIVRVGEIARVELGSEERRAFFRGNGVTRVGLGIVRQSRSNALEVAHGVRRQIDLIQRSLPDDMSIGVTFDSTVFVEEAVNEVWRTLIVAALLVVGVIYLFLGSVRAALIPAATVPVSLIGAFALLAAFGFSINILTLLALVLAIGLVVDDSIVVLENIQRRVDMGEPRTVAADRGGRQVFFAVVATTAVVVAVFAPLAFLAGFVGRLFVELAVTVAGSVVISSFVALTLTPMMASKLLEPASKRSLPARVVDAVTAASRRSYRSSLELLIGRPLVLAAVLAGSGGAAWFLFQALEFELVPPEDRGSARFSMTAAEGAGFDHTVEQAHKIEKILLPYVESGEAETVLVRVPGFGGTGFNSAGGVVLLAPWSERDRGGQEIVAEMNAKLNTLTGVRATLSMRSSLGGGGGDDVQFVIQGPDYDTLDAAAEALIAAAESNPNLSRVRKDVARTSPRVQFVTDAARAAALGVSAQAIGRALETQLGGRRVGTFVRGGEEYDVILQNELSDRRSPTDLSNIEVRSDVSGRLIPLTNLGAIKEVGESAQRPRVDRIRAITVSATLADGYSLGEAVAWFETKADALLPPGLSTELVGAARELRDANAAILFAFGMALLIVYLVLAGQFESFIHPFVIMLTVPLAIAGGLFGLYMAGSSLNIYSQIGLVILVGLAAKNGILIVEFANQLREEGKSIREAVLEASETRFRPILMTGLSTAIGAVPLVLATGAGAESRVTIGVVILAGVTVATLFTLIVIPVFYSLLARFTKAPGWVAREIKAYEGGRASAPGVAAE